MVLMDNNSFNSENQPKINSGKIISTLLSGIFAIATLALLSVLLLQVFGLDKRFNKIDSNMVEIYSLIDERTQVEASINTFTLNNVTFQMPLPWKEHSDDYTADKNCNTETLCSKAISVIPGEGYKLFGDDALKVYTVDVTLMPNHDDLTPQQIVTEQSGTPTKYMKDSSYRIHEYSVFRRRASTANNSFIDLYYAVRSDRSNETIFIRSRLFQRYLNDETGKADSTQNFLRFESAIDAIIPTIIFN